MAEHAERLRVLAGQEHEVVWYQRFDLRYSVGITAGLLDADDAIHCGEPGDRGRLHVACSARRHIVEHHGQVDGFGDGAEVAIEALLGGFVVVGGYG